MTQEQLNILNQLFEKAKYQEVIAQIEENEDMLMDESFIPKLALSYFHTENYGKASGLFEDICAKSQDPVMWFNLSTSSILHNNERRGLEALHTAIKYNRETQTNGKGITTPFMLLYATRALADAGKYNQAFNQLNELAEVYGSLSITDSQFLYARGVPFFDEFLKLSKEVLANQKVTDPKDWIAYLSSHLDDDGKASINNLMT